MRATIPLSRFPLTITIAVVCAIIALVIWLQYPEMVSKVSSYYLKMIKRISNQVFPFFWMHLGIAFLIFLIEAYVVGWKKSSLYSLLHPDKSILSDLFSFLVNTLQLDYVILFMLTMGALHKMKIGLKASVALDQGILASVIASPVLQMVVYILIADLVLYIEHYLHHKWKLLWPFHSYHHSATELNVLTANRGHPIQSEFTNGLISVIPLTIIGVPLVSLLVFRLFRNTLTFMQHSRLPWDWGWIGRYVIVSPAYHRIHHSVLPEHYDKNLAVILPLWDHLFGTFYSGKVPATETGVHDSEYNTRSYLHDLTVPFRMLFRRN